MRSPSASAISGPEESPFRPDSLIRMAGAARTGGRCGGGAGGADAGPGFRSRGSQGARWHEHPGQIRPRARLVHLDITNDGHQDGSHAHYADHRAGCRAGPSAGNAAYRQEHESRRERRVAGRSRDAGQSTPVASFRRVASRCSRTPSRSSRGSTSTGSISSSMSWRRTNAPVNSSGDRSRRQPSPCNPIASEARRRAATVCPGA